MLFLEKTKSKNRFFSGKGFKTMSNKGLFIMLMLSVSLLLGVCTGMVLGTKERADFLAAKAETPSAETPKPTFVLPEQPQEVSLAEKYILTITDTQIIIYKTNADGSMQAIVEKPIDKDGLRTKDYEKLYGGIEFHTLQEARETLEDYIN